MSSLHELRRVGRRVVGPSEELLMDKRLTEEGETLLVRVLEDTRDSSSRLKALGDSLKIANESAREDGAARHASVMVAERTYRAVRHKQALLEELEAGRAAFAKDKDVAVLREILSRLMHNDIPTKPEHNLTPHHLFGLAAEREIERELERRAQAMLEYARQTDSCDGIEQRIQAVLYHGVAREHPACVEAQAIANALREAERLKQRRAVAEARQKELREAQAGASS